MYDLINILFKILRLYHIIVFNLFLPRIMLLIQSNLITLSYNRAISYLSYLFHNNWNNLFGDLHW